MDAKIHMSFEEWEKKLKEGLIGRQSGNEARFYIWSYDFNEICGVNNIKELKHIRKNNKISPRSFRTNTNKRTYWIDITDNPEKQLFTLEIIERIIKDIK